MNDRPFPLGRLRQLAHEGAGIRTIERELGLPLSAIWRVIEAERIRLEPRHSMAKLSSDELQQVLKLRRDGLSLKAIADAIGVTKSCIAHICAGRRWGLGPDGELLPVRRWCSDELPALPPIVEGQDTGQRVMQLIVLVCSS